MKEDRKKIIKILNSGDVKLALELSKSKTDSDLIELCFFVMYSKTKCSFYSFYKNDHIPILIGYLNAKSIRFWDTKTVPQSILEGGISNITFQYQDVESLDFSNISERTKRIIFKFNIYPYEIDGFEVESEYAMEKVYLRK